MMPEDPNLRRILRLLGGALIGVPIAALLVGSGAAIEIARWQPDEIASSILAVLLIMVALITGSFATSKKGYRALTDEGLGEPVEAETLSTLRRQALAIAVLLAILFWFNLRLSRESDELTRAVNAEASAWTLGLGTLALFGWSALEKLLLVPAIGSWGLLTAGIGLSFLVWMVVSVRRGLVGR